MKPCLYTTRAGWFVATSTTFTVAYWIANRLTSMRESLGAGVFAWEASIPFVSWTIVPYLSIGLFFAVSFFVDPDNMNLRRHVWRLLFVLGISLICYALFPLRFTFDRPPTDGVFGLLFGALGEFDLPFNRAPSLHISVLVVLWGRLTPCLSHWQRAALQTWFCLIATSVLTTYQHHVIDMLSGLALGCIAIAITTPWAAGASRRTSGRASAA